TIGFHRELVDSGFPVAGIIANRVLAFPGLENGAHAVTGWEPTLAAKLLKNYAEVHELSRRDQRALRRLHEATHAPLLAPVPAVSEAPTSMVGLQRFAQLLVP